MGIDIKVPTLGESVTTATVARWLKKAGESVAADEPIVELETDKVTVEVPSPQAGVLEAIQAEEGAEVEVGAVLATVQAGTGSSAKAPAPAANPSAGVNPPPAPRGPVSRPATPAPEAPKAEQGRHAPMPSASKMMEDRGVQASQLDGTGREGRITKGDVIDFLARAGGDPDSRAGTARRPCGAGRRRARQDDPAAAHHRAAAERCAEHRGDADHLQRGRYERRDGVALRISRRVREEA